MGSNMAECHPVAFRWVMQAKTRATNPCTVIHADPRFTRTSAMADIYAPVRAGSDIVFLGALINHALQYHEGIRQKPADQRSERERFFHDYLVHYTNAAALLTEEFQDTEDADGVFSGRDREARRYDPRSWRYDTEPGRQPGEPRPGDGRSESFTAQVGQLVGPRPRQDRTLAHQRCVSPV